MEWGSDSTDSCFMGTSTSVLMLNSCLLFLSVSLLFDRPSLLLFAALLLTCPHLAALLSTDLRL